MSAVCQCPVPAQVGKDRNPRRSRKHCDRCGRYLDPAWVSSDATTAAFFDRLEETFPTLPGWWESYRALCEHREYEGREHFAFSSFGKDLPVEGGEELADCGVYAHLQLLKDIRAGDTDDADLLFVAAHHAALAYEALMHYRAKEAGAP